MVTPSSFPSYINEQSKNNQHIFSIYLNKTKIEGLLLFNTSILDNKKLTFDFNYYHSLNAIKLNIYDSFKVKVNNIIHNKKIDKINIININVNKTIDSVKLKDIKFNKKILKIENIKKINLEKYPNFQKTKLLYIKNSIFVKKFDFMTSPFDIDDIQKYITKDSPYKLIIKFRKINKVIYPRTNIIYYNKPTKRI